MFQTQILAPIEMLGKSLPVRIERRRIRNAYARVKNDHIVIELPIHMGALRSRTVTGLLYKRIKRSIEKNPARYAEIKSLKFHEGQMLSVLGNDFTIHIETVQGIKTIRASLENGVVRVTLPDAQGNEKLEALTSKLIIRVISNAVHQNLVDYIESYNIKYFHSNIPKVSIRDTLKVMGSCAPDNSIMVNFRILYADQSMLDYIIVHELSHTKFKNHSKRFWSLVSSIMPDYKERRKWLKNNLSMLALS